MHRDGFGFVIPDRPIEGVQGDIYLSPSSASEAMHGDRVLIRITRADSTGRAEGSILKILKRAHTTVVGEFRARRGSNVVIPHDDRITAWIEIPEGLEVPSAPSQDRIGAVPPNPSRPKNSTA